MNKIKKIFLVAIAVLIFLFFAQKAANTYVEHKINACLAPYNIKATLERLSILTLSRPPFTITCKIKLEGSKVVLIPLSSNLFSKLLPKQINLGY